MTLPYSYVANVPQGTQQVNNTQQPINGNFQDIYDLLAINHIPFNTANTFGRHSYVSYVEQDADPSTASNEMALYSKAVTNDTNGAELFYRYPNSGTVVQLTGVSSSSTGGTGASSGGVFTCATTPPFGYATQGSWQYLSNGILIMTYAINNYFQTTPVPTANYTTYFPSGTYANGVVVPTFTQTPFSIQIAANGAQGNSGTDTGYAATLVNNTSATIHYVGAIPSTPPSTIYASYITVIGI